MYSAYLKSHEQVQVSKLIALSAGMKAMFGDKDCD